MPQPLWLNHKPIGFPPTHLAMSDPNGLLAIGGDLTTEWLLEAYKKGIFPWFNEDDPILWWTPNPRSVLFTDMLKVHKSLQKTIRKGRFQVTLDQAFVDVMKQCAEVPRAEQDGTWITQQMLEAYTNLHQSGHAHSVEVWQEKQLVGGLYGVSIGKVFFGESMFSKATDASKVALVALCDQLRHWGFRIIDTQIETAHLKSLGAKLISREQFEKLIEEDIPKPAPPHPWSLASDWSTSYHSSTSAKEV